jgi:hypothetical protein
MVGAGMGGAVLVGGDLEAPSAALVALTWAVSVALTLAASAEPWLPQHAASMAIIIVMAPICLVTEMPTGMAAGNVPWTVGGMVDNGRTSVTDNMLIIERADALHCAVARDDLSDEMMSSSCSHVTVGPFLRSRPAWRAAGGGLVRRSHRLRYGDGRLDAVRSVAPKPKGL